PLAMRLAIYAGIIDRPNERSVSRRPDMPLLGGIAVGLGFAAGLAVALRQVAPPTPDGHLLALALGGSLLLAAGIYDDRRGMNAWAKFSVQIIAAVLATASGYHIDHLTEPFSRTTFFLPTWLSWTVTVLWIVTVTNAINLVDGLDGLAAGVAAIIAATLALLAAQAGEIFGACMGVALVGALLGFLPFNFAPARIFLGDTGALFIGYVLALLALEGYRQVTLLTFVVPLLALAVPILDTALSVIRRLRNHAPIFNADRQHMHHRMLEFEGSARSAVFQVYVLTAAFCLISMAFSKLEGYMALLFLAAVALLTYRLVANLGALSREPHAAAPSSAELASGKDER
ncbi:MAG TPA: MraY family glycosyltransferase, partial [Myxococcota bacterium]|nr:MraY family glycosyltransferase [Myxococcota bacterium]